MSRVLLLDSSFAARPIHDWLVKQDFDVWTIGNRKRDVLAQRDPERHLNENYSDVARVQTYIDQYNFDYVVPGCTDVSIETALHLRGLKTKVDSPTTYNQIADKAAFRALCLHLSLSAPRQIFPEELPMRGHFLAKPVDSFSGRGISVFDGMDRNAATHALGKARAESRRGDAIIETFINGQLYSYSCFLEEQRVVDSTIVHEDGSVTPYAVDTSYVCFDLPEHGVQSVRESIERLAHHLHLVDGLLHAQFIWDGNQPWLIELSRRCPGDLYPRLVQLSTGKPHAEKYASYFVDLPAPQYEGKRQHILRHTVTAEKKTYEGLWFDRRVPVLELHPLCSIGREVSESAHVDRVALVFCQLQSHRELLHTHERFLHRRAYESRIARKA